MTKSQLTQLVREVVQELDEANTSSATPGYSTPFAFGKDKRATKALKRIGYKKV